MKPKKNFKPFAKKSFGQNFLTDENYVNRIISALNLSATDAVIEIGAGRGALTEKLLASGAKVVAVELEKDMIEVLRTRFINAENFVLIEADALKVDFYEIQKTHFQGAQIKLAANLPYYISTAILQKLIAARACLAEMILMFQREVVERITAEVGNSERGFLTVLVENYLETKKLFDVPPNAFRPAPKVWSAVASLTPKIESGVTDEERFRRIVSAAFMQKRKTIFNNLKNSNLADAAKIEEILLQADIEASRRAESLTLSEWRNLAAAFERI